MSKAPSTLSVKRKRTEAPVDALIFDNTVKRQRSEADIFFRRLTKPGDTPAPAATPSASRRFHLDPVSRARSKHVFIEHRAAPAPSPTPTAPHEPAQEPLRPRKRPGTRAPSAAIPQANLRTQPSEHDIRALEALSQHLSTPPAPAPAPASPSRHKPKPPTRRFAEREPEKAAALAARDDAEADGDAMDLDTDTDYVIDVYVREALLPDASGQLPTASGTVGYLVLEDADSGWWGADSDSESVETDGDDSNAEEYYANDYPEDELSSDDEFGREPWKRAHRRGSDDEGEDVGSDVVGSGDEDDEHYRMTVPKGGRGYWGMVGQ